MIGLALYPADLRGARRRHAGFTLLELLVGMAVFAVLASIVLGGIRLGLQSWNAADTKNSAVDEIRIAHGFLRRQIGAARPLAVVRSGKIVFEGGRDDLVFVAEMPSYVGGGGVHFINLAVDEDEEGKRLMLRWRPLHAFDDSGWPEETELARGLSGVTLKYFGALKRNALLAWRDSWREAKQLPKLVKLSVRDAAGDDWPDLVVALDVDAVRFVSDADPGVNPDSDVPVVPQDSGDS
jgi:general secretion pathway protein J